MLQAKRIPVTLVDSNASQIERVADFGIKVYFGDGTRIDLLRTAGAETAEAILFCHDDRSMTRDKLQAVLEAFPQALVMVRVFDRLDEIALGGLDVALIQREVFESAIAMGTEALHRLRIADREVERVEREYRLRDSERLQAQSETGDLHAGAERSFSEDRPLPDEPADPAKSCG
jgi:voltage-gated potassium channel Kch